MKLISWNVNGLRSCVNKGFIDTFKDLNADVVCLQETKLQEGQIELELEGYYDFWNYAEKKGYSGTAVFTRENPLSVAYGMGIEEHDKEGRVITLKFDKFYLVNVYTPNSKRGLERLDYRMQWEDDFRRYLLKLNHQKPVVMCGDLNVAHKEIDLKNPKTNRKNAGFTDEERDKIFYPDKEEAYSWWSNFAKSRERNVGWRIDYFIASDSLKEELVDAFICPEYMGSDHCPVGLVTR